VRGCKPLVAAIAVLALGGWVGAAGAASVVTVHPGQSIQAAVNAASPGDTIMVEAGV